MSTRRRVSLAAAYTYHVHPADPLSPVQCPNEKCRNDEAYWYQLQIRSADEPMTAFYKVHASLQPSRACAPANIAAVHKMRKGVARVEPHMLSPRRLRCCCLLLDIPPFRECHSLYYTHISASCCTVHYLVNHLLYIPCWPRLDLTNPSSHRLTSPARPQSLHATHQIAAPAPPRPARQNPNPRPRAPQAADSLSPACYSAMPTAHQSQCAHPARFPPSVDSAPVLPQVRIDQAWLIATTALTAS
jgi:hypothetical protein